MIIFECATPELLIDTQYINQHLKEHLKPMIVVLDVRLFHVIRTNNCNVGEH
jgi:hypothetical protein